ncbi:MAG: hypothetical protein IJY15_06075, partial [Thermoguttaceae bacterium]|nr:hypothetical protein [Thermoguttaceae bacterium]
VGATERRGGRRGVISASYQETAENGKDAKDAVKAQTEENGEDGASAPVERVAQIAKKEQTGRNNAAAETRLKSGDEKKDGKNVQNRENGGNAGSGERVRFRVRALAVRIGTPRGYVCRVAQHLKAENAVETFATDGETNDWSSFYRSAERKIVAETKNIALLLLRPLAERNGWCENELTRSVAVDVYAAPDDWNASSVGAKGETARGVDGKNENGPFEVVANFGQVANVEEMVAEVAEETTSDAETVKTTLEDANERETESPETANFWASWKERTRRLDAKTTAAIRVGVGILAFLTIVAPATRRRGKKTAKSRDDVEKRSDEDEATQTSDGGERPNLRKKRNKEDGEKKRKKERAEIKEIGKSAQDDEVASDVRVERNGRSAQNGRNGRNAREDEEIRGERETGDDGAKDETKSDALRNVRDFPTARAERRSVVARGRGGVLTNAEDRAERRASNGANAGEGGFSTGTVENKTTVDFEEFDDWDDLDDDLLEIRSLIERERARVDEEPASERTTRSFGDAARRREALELIARNPEQAAESLRRWLRPGA